MKKNKYQASSIKIYEGIEAVKKRPAMYLGSTDNDGFHHLVWEIVDNALDEYLAGFAKTIEVTLLKNNFVKVNDDGRGIPVDIHPRTQLSTIETVFTYLHAGGKFDRQTYMVSGGLHGVGSTVVNAMSENLKINVYKKSETYSLEFKNGTKTTKNLQVTKNLTNRQNGTEVIFKPNLNLFDENYEYETSLIQKKLEQTAYINPGIRIIFKDERKNLSKTYHFENGFQAFLSKIVGSDENLKNQHQKIIGGSFQEQGVKVSFTFRYTNTNKTKFLSFCNNIPTTEGGTHEKGFRMGIGRIIKRFLKKEGKNYRYYDSKKDKIETSDIVSGICLILVVLHPNPKFSGQTKTKLVNLGIQSLMSQNIGEIFERFLLENPKEKQIIMQKIIQSLRLRIELNNKMKEFRNKNSLLENSTLPGKLADCSKRDPQECEIFIVEGDSAGGSAKLGRNRNFQAILPLKGKIINGEKVTNAKLFANQEIIDLIACLGLNFRKISHNCEEHQKYQCSECNKKTIENKLRYHKIIIMTDADVDGEHISVLLLTFIYRFLRALIENGFVYLAQPPLYKFKVGKKIKYLYNKESLKKEIAKIDGKKYEIQRYKGLGEMNPNQLWETTMDPKHRILKQIMVSDFDKADATTNLLMGKKVEGRKKFIIENAKFVENLSI